MFENNAGNIQLFRAPIYTFRRISKGVPVSPMYTLSQSVQGMTLLEWQN